MEKFVRLVLLKSCIDSLFRKGEYFVLRRASTESCRISNFRNKSERHHDSARRNETAEACHTHARARAPLIPLVCLLPPPPPFFHFPLVCCSSPCAPCLSDLLPLPLLSCCMSLRLEGRTGLGGLCSVPLCSCRPDVDRRSRCQY